MLLHWQNTVNSLNPLDDAMFLSGEISLSFADTYQYVAKVGGYLQAQYGKGKIIAYKEDKNFFSYILPLACWLSGNIYMPIHPKQNISLIKYDCLFTNKEIDLSRNYHFIPQKQWMDSDLVCIFSTSGSSGEIKLVPITVKQINCFLENVFERLPLEKIKIMSSFYHPSFDPFYAELWIALRFRKTLVPFFLKDTHCFESWVNDNQVDYWSSTPSFLSYLMGHAKKNRLNITRIKTSIFTGEAINACDLLDWRILVDNDDQYNFYGPTEACIWIASTKISPLLEEVNHLGSIFKGNQYKILKHESGNELLISGDQVINTYFNSENKDAFFDREAVKWYKTGDMVEVGNDNRLTFLGRANSSIKIRGQFVHLELIEKKISTAMNINVKLVAKPYDQLQKTGLSIFLEHNHVLDDQFLSEVRKYLPFSVKISDFIFVEKFPLLPSGKIDKELLCQNVKVYESKV